MKTILKLNNVDSYVILLLLLVIPTSTIFSQAPGCPGVTVSDDVTLNCVSSGTTNLSANYLEIGETTSYNVSSISYAPPFSYTGLANPISVGTDDVWSPIVNLPFNFCFYGNMYTECVISSNGAISFNTTDNTPGGYSTWSFSETVPDANLFLDTIFSIYHDMDPSLGGEIAWELLGTAPCRKLVVSYHDVPLYSCSSSLSTFQIVLYEATNIIELYVEEKSACSDWNSGNSVIGVQNATGDTGLAAPGRNTSDWSVSPSAPEAWRFTPSGTGITSIKWYDASTGGSVVGNTNTVSVSPTSTTTYRAEVEYLMCDGSLVVESDTVTVNVDFCPTTIDFDGVDDFVAVDPLMGGLSNVSQMGWINLDSSFTGRGTIIGESNNILEVRNNKKIRAIIKTTTGNYDVTTSEAIIPGQWAHIASVYDGSTLKVYINGEEKGSVNVGGTLLASTSDYTIGKNGVTNSRYVDAFLQEIRVYDVALTEVQLKEQVYQPIQDNAGNVRGTVLAQDINGLTWSDLVLYLKLSQANTGTTSDDSVASNTALLHNMTTAQELTAPIPYKANASGTWTSVGTWENGDVWDIMSLPNKDWAIVQITNNAKVTTTASHTHLGLIVDAGAELEILNDQLLQNTKYLRLDGQIDLEGEAQLIQTTNSELDATSSGYIERDQDGKSNLYQYNYWSSPVGTINTTTNNSDYTVAGVLRDGTIPTSPQNIIFTEEGYDGAPTSPITLADFWIFQFENKADIYANWNQERSSGTIKVGEGFTMKGSGASSVTQNYTFTGKPNNGQIQHAIDGNNKYLLGNPYPSALDANAFILANIGANPSTTGTLYFWEHWGGASHILAEYEGGYATYNLLGGVLAVSNPMVSNNGSGTLAPQQYVPVAQGFFVQGDSDGGMVDFANSQRVFQKESSGNSTFIRSANETIEVSKVYFSFTTPEGPKRQLLLGIKEGLTLDVENGYDAKRFNEQYTDCAWGILNEPYVIQGIGEVYEGLELPLQIKVGASGTCKFNIESLEGLDENLEVYFKDSELQTEIKLEGNLETSFYLNSGNYTNRFSVVFKTSEVLNVEELSIEEPVVFYNSNIGAINLVNPLSLSISKIRLIDILGKEIVTNRKFDTNDTEIVIPVQVASGTYLVEFMLENRRIVKKIIIN